MNYWFSCFPWYVAAASRGRFFYGWEGWYIREDATPDSASAGQGVEVQTLKAFSGSLSVFDFEKSEDFGKTRHSLHLCTLSMSGSRGWQCRKRENQKPKDETFDAPQGE